MLIRKDHPLECRRQPIVNPQSQANRVTEVVAGFANPLSWPVYALETQPVLPYEAPFAVLARQADHIQVGINPGNHVAKLEVSVPVELGDIPEP